MSRAMKILLALVIAAFMVAHVVAVVAMDGSHARSAATAPVPSGD